VYEYDVAHWGLSPEGRCSGCPRSEKRGCRDSRAQHRKLATTDSHRYPLTSLVTGSSHTATVAVLAAARV
jgi:hypothetical protein